MKIFTKKFFLYTFSTFFVLSVLIFTLGYFFLDDIVDARLQKLISKKFGTFYSLNYESIEKDIGLTEISFVVNKAEFTSDTTDLAGMEKFPVFFFEAKTLKVERISTWNVLLGSTLDLDNILLEEPNLKVFTQNKKTNSNSEVKNRRGKSILSSVKINRFLLDEGSVQFIDFQTQKITFESSSILVDVNTIELDLTTLNDYKSFLSFQEVSIESTAPSFTPLKGFYTYKMGSMSLSSKKKNLSFKDIDINTKKSLKEASKEVINHKELVNVMIETIDINRIDLKKIIFDTKIEVGKINVKNSYIHIFKNNQKHLDSDFKKSVFNELIRSIPIPVMVDTIQLNQVDIDFELMNSTHNQPAKINFLINNGYIANFNTDVNSTDTLTFFAEGKFMKRGSLWITAHILVSDTVNNYQQFMGSIKNMPFKILNPLIKQFANADISSGYIDEISFNGTANSHRTTGSVIFKYTDLKIEFYKKKDARKRFFLLSEIANASTHKNNPNKKGELVGAHFNSQRKRWQGSVGMWLGGIIEGMFNVAVKEFPKEVLEKESKRKKGTLHKDKLHLFHKKKNNGEEPKKKNKLFHRKKNKKP